MRLKIGAALLAALLVVGAVPASARITTGYASPAAEPVAEGYDFPSHWRHTESPAKVVNHADNASVAFRCQDRLTDCRVALVVHYTEARFVAYDGDDGIGGFSETRWVRARIEENRGRNATGWNYTLGS